MSSLPHFQYYGPSTLKETLRLLTKMRGPLLLGGGTFVLSVLKKTQRPPKEVIGLRKIPELRGIRVSKKEIRLGAMTTIAEAAESDVIRDHFLSLHKACWSLATTHIRNMATIGGNIAAPLLWADLPAVLISLGARVILMAPGGRRELGLLDFLTQRPSKRFVLTNIVLPKGGTPYLTRYFRHTRGMEVDVPSCALAFSASLQKKRLKNVKLVINTASSHPVEAKLSQATFEDKDLKKIGCEKVKDALKKDLQKTQLDAYRIHCLCIDIESLIYSLKNRDR